MISIGAEAIDRAILTSRGRDPTSPISSKGYDRPQNTKGGKDAYFNTTELLVLTYHRMLVSTTLKMKIFNEPSTAHRRTTRKRR